ncbi:hypothetical protein M23134_00998 [Microscilla marina ATCC 23134]|uniref:Uncharacterized protein n=2 Tax=Microscilla marina TaxID=1027 RepID=A1ZZH8_MICM2|nr:hypothetical protein M23134_00998 [Microscilla marina ATCC 23134]
MSDIQLFIMNYKPESKHMTNEDFKEYILHLKTLTNQYKPSFILDDSRKRGFILEPEMQDWVVAELVPGWINFELQKYAQVLAEDLFSNISGQQIVEVARKIPGMFETKFFDKPQDAATWFEIQVELPASVV